MSKFLVAYADRSVYIVRPGTQLSKEAVARMWWGCNKAEREPLANLFAAAPDLLEALERAIEFLPDPSVRGVKTIPASTQVAIDARAAIAKARGEA